MISPQMSAWVRVWAWVSGGQGGGVSFYLGGPLVRGAGCGARGPRGAGELPGGGGGSAPAAAPVTTPGGGCGWARRRPSPKKISPQRPQNPKPKRQQQKKGFAGRRCRGRGAAGSAVPRRVPAARGAAGRRGPAGPPGPRSAPGPGSEESLPGSLRPPCSAAGCGPVAAVRSGAKRSAFWRSVVSCY